MEFNFGKSGNTTDFSIQGSAPALNAQPGESALFGPGELDTDFDFSDGQGTPLVPTADEPAPAQPAQPAAPAKGKPAAQPKPKGKKPTEEEAAPELPEKPVLSSIDLELEDEEEEGGQPDGNQPANTDGGEPGDGEDDENYNPYADYAKDMFAAGIFTPLEGDDEIEFGDENALKERFMREKQVGANQIVHQFLGKFGPEHKKAFNAIFVHGNDPEIYYQKTAHIENLENADLTDPGTQERLVRAYLGQLGWQEADINSRIEKVKTYDDLESESKTAQRHLIKHQQDSLAANAVENQRRLAQEQELANMYTSGVHHTLTEALSKKDLGGLPMNKETAGRIYDMMTNKKWEVNGKEMTTLERMLEELKDPRNVELAAKVSWVLDNKFDFSSIKKKAVSEETHQLFTNIKRKQTNQRSGRPTKAAGDNWTF